LVEGFRNAGLKVQTYTNAAAMKWSKLLTNLIGNATSAILDMSVAEMYAQPQVFQLETRMLRECLAVMRAQRLPVVDLPRTPVRALAFAVERLPGWLAQPLLQRAVGAGRGGKMPSFHGDVAAGRNPTEVRWLNGAVVRYGAQHNVATPVNATLTDTLEQITAGRLARDAMRQHPEALFRLIK
jgi:2-dehydropantoate 2-reductase